MSKPVIIFDFDNTLVKSHINFPAMKIQMARSVKKIGLDFGRLEEIPTKYTAGNIIDQAEIYDKENNTEVVKQLWKIVENYERQGLTDLTIDDNIFSMLKQLKEANFPLVILTNNARNPTIEVLKKYELDDYFDLVIAREDVVKMKPDKEGLELIIKKFSVKPIQAVFIGDSWVDCLAANKANIRFILIRDKMLDTVRHNIKIWKHITSVKDLIPIITNNL